MLHAREKPQVPVPLGSTQLENTSASAPGAAPHYLEHRQRLRPRFLNAGADSLADYELLELILFRAIPRSDLKPLAKELLVKFGSLPEVVSARRGGVSEKRRLGHASLAEIKTRKGAGSRLARGQVRERHVLSSWS